MLVAGYHPFAEDGGLYLAGARYLLDPSLFPASRPFVTAHLHYSLFAPLLAFLVRQSALPLETVVLAAHLLCIWATLFAAWLLATVLFPPQAPSSIATGISLPDATAARTGAVLLLAVWLGLPVAGTSLTIADPYLTARSISTPCVLLALAAAVRIRQLQLARLPPSTLTVLGCVCALAFGALFHPLMAGYGAICIGTFAALATRGSALRRSCILALAALLTSVTLLKTQPPEAPSARFAALSRSYWFLAQWHWYEWLGLLAPVLLLACLALRGPSRPLRELCRAIAVAGVLSLLVAMLFISPDAKSLALARLQPLRLFQVVYLVMTVVLGGLLGTLLRSTPWRWCLAVLLLATPMIPFAASHFTASSWLELTPRAVHANPWSAAFLWCRDHTSKDAVFALDANYIAIPGEDAQSFRALAGRSSLADQAKDGGEAAITPSLAPLWLRDLRATDSLSRLSDAERRSRLLPLGITWLLLESSAPTRQSCPYNNGVVKVCPVP